MQLSNRYGTPVDPVPFLVVALAGAMMCFVCGPPYLLALGLSFGPAVAVTTAVAALAAVAAYYELVWSAVESGDVARPAGPRLQRIGYAAGAAVAVGVGLLLPFV